MVMGPIPSTPPIEQLTDDVLPPYKDFLSDNTARHKARASANALAHFSEHVFEYFNHHDPARLSGKTTAKDFVSFLARTEQCEALDIIWDFALAGKHRFVTQPPSRERQPSMVLVTSSTGVFCGDDNDPVRIKLDDGRVMYMSVVNISAIQFWQRWLS